MNERIAKFKNKEKYTTEDIAELVEILRSELGCAWDREQTQQSIRSGIIEETYEFIEGLDTNDNELMCEELGDVLFQIFFHAQIAKENKNFSINDVADGICKKMVLRHPHVFGDIKVKDSAEVLKNWDDIKKNEKSREGLEKQLHSVSKALPSLIRSEKLLSRYKKEGGYVEKDCTKLVQQLKDKVNSLEDSINENNIGELLFLVANICYASDINSDEALYRENERYITEKVKEMKL